MKKPRKIIIAGDVACIPLTKGYVATIDAADVHLVEVCNWTAVEAFKSDGTLRAVYAKRRYEGKTLYLHRALVVVGDDFEIDHKDCDGLNNRRANLRTATKSQNQHNKRIQLNNTSGIKGVFFDSKNNRWVARIGLNGKQRHIGCFKCLDDAANAYNKAAEMLHGEFAKTAP